MGDRMNRLTDAELVVLTREGNTKAFNSLVERWDASLYRFARRLLGNPEDARDVSQEALVKAYLNIRRLRDPEKFKAWVHHITLNLCRDRHRSPRSRVVTRPLDDDEPASPASWPGAATAAPDREAHRAGLAGVLGEVLDRLPAEQRVAILLREYQGLTSQEIAEITGVPATTVRTRIYYGLKSVRRMLQDRGIDGAGLDSR